MPPRRRGRVGSSIGADGAAAVDVASSRDLNEAGPADGSPEGGEVTRGSVDDGGGPLPEVLRGGAIEAASPEGNTDSLG